MKLPRIEIDEQILIDLSQKYNIIELGLFGSVLRDDFSIHSDIDILIVFSPDSEYSYFDLLHIKKEFEDRLGRSVDLIEKEGIRNPYRREEILSTNKVIYAA
ncbi:MAG: DNA polymerase subunit beta [Calditrichaeota bacterium]|nr:nucleotidyltransferase domain-containing protein [Spirochaetales bacterium]RQV99616.1 MAG: DNA polymerase subunit beta [Calditrichota bacterium]